MYLTASNKIEFSYKFLDITTRIVVMNALCAVTILSSFVWRAIEAQGNANAQTSQLDPPNVPLTFPSSFKMTIDLYYNVHGNKENISATVWMDREKQFARMDTYGSILKTFVKRSGQKSEYYNVYPVAINSEDVCVLSTSMKNDTNYFTNMNAYFESNFKYVGKEQFRGVETYKWKNETLQISIYLRLQKSIKDPSKEVITPVAVTIGPTTTSPVFQRVEVTSFSEENLPEELFNGLDKLQCINSDALDKTYDKIKEDCLETHEEEFSVFSYDVPESFDWREEGAVNEIDRCDREMSWSCAATAVLEGGYFLRTNRTNLFRLSKQALMDCSVTYKYGVEMNPKFGESYAYEWIIYNKGMPEENHYPGPNTGLHESCKIQNVTKPMTASISHWGKVPAGNITALKAAIIGHGPLAVHLEADISSMMKHSDGIFRDPTCGDPNFKLPYSGLLVGFGKENNVEYWTVNPFWGNNVGQQGYFKIAIENNICGVTNEATFVIF